MKKIEINSATVMYTAWISPLIIFQLTFSHMDIFLWDGDQFNCLIIVCVAQKILMSESKDRKINWCASAYLVLAIYDTDHADSYIVYKALHSSLFHSLCLSHIAVIPLGLVQGDFEQKTYDTETHNPKLTGWGQCGEAALTQPK